MVSGNCSVQITVQSPMKLGMPSSNAIRVPELGFSEKTSTYKLFISYLLGISNTFCHKVTICVTSYLFS